MGWMDLILTCQSFRLKSILHLLLLLIQFPPHLPTHPRPPPPCPCPYLQMPLLMSKRLSTPNALLLPMRLCPHFSSPHVRYHHH